MKRHWLFLAAGLLTGVVLVIAGAQYYCEHAFKPEPLLRENPLPPLKLFRRDFNKHLYRFTGAFCSGSSCPGWELINFDPGTREVAVNLQDVFILIGAPDTHRIWRWKGEPCQEGRNDRCYSWEMVDRTSATITTIVAAGSFLYQLRTDGRILRWTGAACTGEFCPGWELLRGPDADLAEIAAGGRWAYARRRNGEVWMFDGPPCSGQSCTGWRKISDDPRTRKIFAARGELYRLNDNGGLFAWQRQVMVMFSTWREIDRGNTVLTMVTDGPHVWKIHTDRTIYSYRGFGCDSAECPGWVRIGHAPAVQSMVADHGRLFRADNPSGGENQRVLVYMPWFCQQDPCENWDTIQDGRPHGNFIYAAIP